MNIKASMLKICIFMAVLICVFAPFKSLETAIEHHSPFRYSGDGKIALVDMHTGEKVSVIYRDVKGGYDAAALSAIDNVLRCHGKSERYPISQKLVELVDYLQDSFGAKEVRVVSGYRSPEYNENLRRTIARVAHDSLHMQGLAMDIQLEGVSKDGLGRLARALKSGGVGVYSSSDYVHVDAGPVRDW